MEDLHFFPEHHRNEFFHSNEWVNAWQTSWGDHPAIKPLDQQGFFYSTRIKKKKILSINTAFPAGTSIGSADSIRCEYLFIGKSGSSTDNRTQDFLSQAMDSSWDELWLPDLITQSDDYKEILRIAPAFNLHPIVVQRELSYAVDLRVGTFQDYLARLSANTRPKIYNRRKKLEAAGHITINNIWPDKEKFLAILNGFHEKRWGTPCYHGRNLLFINNLLDNLARNGKVIDLSIMELNGEPISVMLDIHSKGRCYNLQSGYKEDFLPGLSLGTLHFGYQIEAAFRAGLEFYDFMAGKGKNHQYKAALSNTTTELTSLVLVRSSLLKLFYTIYYRLTHRSNHT